MTESDIWKRIKRWLPGYSIRVENIITSGISDVLWCPNGLSIFLELKIREGKYIYVRNSQVVFGIHAAKSVPSHQHLFVVGNEKYDNLFLYQYNTVMMCPSILAGEGKQRFLIAAVVPDLVWYEANDVRSYVEFLEKAPRDGTAIRLSSQSK